MNTASRTVVATTAGKPLQFVRDPAELHQGVVPPPAVPDHRRAMERLPERGREGFTAGLRAWADEMRDW